MILGFIFGFKKFWSEFYSGDLLILSLSIVLAVTSISSVSFLGDRLQSAMKIQAASILAADLVLRSAEELDSEYLQQAKANNLKTAKTVTFLSMALANEDNLLTSIKSASNGYPLRGQLKISNLANEVLINPGIPSSGEIWIEPRIADVLEVDLGDELSVGNKTFVISGFIQDIPDRNSTFVGFYPMAIANISDLDDMGVIQTGSRVVYRYLFSGAVADLEAFKEDLGKLPAEIRLQEADNVGEDIDEAFDDSVAYFSLASLFTILISLISSMLAVRRYAVRSLLKTSLMKVFGASKSFIFGYQIMQLILIVLIATCIGLFFGYNLHALLISTLQELINADLPTPSWNPVIIGFITSIFIVFGTITPYLRILGNAEPIRVLRNDFSLNISANLPIYLFTAASLFVFLAIVFQNLKLIVYLSVTVIFVTVVLYVIGRLLIYFLSLLNLSSGVGWKLGLKNIVHRGKDSILQIIIFGLSLLFLIVLAETRTDLVDSWNKSLDEDTPNYFLFNIQEYDLADIKGYFADRAQPEPLFTPLIRGRLIEAYRKSTDTVQSENLMDREANLTWQESLPESNVITEGEWWDANSTNREVSVDQELASYMNLELGDKLTFTAGGTNFTVTVSSFREIEWESFSPNFFFILSPSAGKDLPSSYITSVRVDTHSKLMEDFIAFFPTITSIDIGAIINQVKNTISSASLAVQYIFLLTMIAGVLALIASIYSTRDQRTEETAILHAIGANRRTIFFSAAAEFFILGLLAALTAIIFAVVLSSIIFSQFLELTYSPNSFILITALLTGVTLIFLAGIISIRKTIYTSPMVALRD